MPQQRMDIRMIKDILRLKYSAALSHEAIARGLGCWRRPKIDPLVRVVPIQI